MCAVLALVSACGGPPAPLAAATGATYYVASYGNDGNDCHSPGTPCLTIGAAIAKTAPGDVVKVGIGAYHEQISLTHDLTIAGAGAGQTLVDGSGISGTLVTVSAATTALVAGLTIQNGSTYDGSSAGGITNAGTLTLADSRIVGNSTDAISHDAGGSAHSSSGGLYNSGVVTLIHSVIAGNSGIAGQDAQANGGVYTTGAVTLISSTVSGNSAAGTGGIGSYGYSSSVTLLDSTVGDNGGLTGGLDSVFGALIVVNSTIDGNSGGVTGAIYTSSGTTILANSTISGNNAGARGSGGVDDYGSSVTLFNTILAGNTSSAEPDCNGTLISHGYNVLGDDTGCSGLGNGIAGDQVGTAGNPLDPRLGPPRDNGGPTLTRALLPGSPAIDAGNPGGCADAQGNPLTVDQRGLPRPDGVNRRCDAGAYELQAPAIDTATSTPVPTATMPTRITVTTGTATATRTTVTTGTATATRTTVTTGTATATPAAATTRRVPVPPVRVRTATPVRPLAQQATLPLSLQLGVRSVVAGGTLAIGLRTAPHARVRVALRAIADRVVIRGSGTRRYAVTLRVLLYQAILDGATDARGHYSGRLRVAYRPAGPAPVPALLIVTTRTARGAATRAIAITIEPAPRAARRHHKRP